MAVECAQAGLDKTERLLADAVSKVLSRLPLFVIVSCNVLFSFAGCDGVDRWKAARRVRYPFEGRVFPAHSPRQHFCALLPGLVSSCAFFADPLLVLCSA